MGRARSARQRVLGFCFNAVHFHAGMAGVWLLLLAPTLLIWRESLVWIVTMSWYANLVGEVSAFQAAKGERETVSNEQHDALMRELAAVRRELKAVRKAQAA